MYTLPLQDKSIRESMGTLLHAVGVYTYKRGQDWLITVHFLTYANSFRPASFFPETLSNHLATLFNMSAIHTHFSNTQHNLSEIGAQVLQQYSKSSRPLRATASYGAACLRLLQAFVARRECQSSLTRGDRVEVLTVSTP